MIDQPTMGSAARTLIHYVRLLMREHGIPVTPDMQEEFNDIVAAFDSASSRLSMAVKEVEPD